MESLCPCTLNMKSIFAVPPSVNTSNSLNRSSLISSPVMIPDRNADKRLLHPSFLKSFAPSYYYSIPVKNIPPPTPL